ncbi:MAG: zinc-dependent alcohol dehydrogenase family protein [Burkholderiales bacterium]
MRALLLESPRRPLVLSEVPKPSPSAGEVLLRVRACGVCRTDLHLIDGELIPNQLPIIPGHEIVGEVIAAGKAAKRFQTGQRVGVPWLASSCGVCRYCESGRENLCENARFTGYHVHGGYAEYALADERYCFAIPDSYSDSHAAPLLCAGLIGYRALSFAGEAKRVGLYGFGAAAHIITQVARFEGREVYAFTRPGDADGQRFALELGAHWAGDSQSAPPEPLDAAIIFAPVGALIPAALKFVAKGGRVICAGIHMDDIPAFPYSLIWGEREIKSVANLTRRDGEAFFAIAPRVPIKTEVECFALAQANDALARLRAGKIRGAAVLQP